MRWGTLLAGPRRPGPFTFQKVFRGPSSVRFTADSRCVRCQLAPYKLLAASLQSSGTISALPQQLTVAACVVAQQLSRLEALAPHLGRRSIELIVAWALCTVIPGACRPVSDLEDLAHLAQAPPAQCTLMVCFFLAWSHHHELAVMLSLLRQAKVSPYGCPALLPAVTIFCARSASNCRPISPLAVGHGPRLL